MELAVGDAVTVINIETVEDDVDFNGLHGLIVSIDESTNHPDGSIRVNFSEQHRRKFDCSGNGYNSEASMRFKKENLKKESQLHWVDQAYRKWPPSKGCAHWDHYEVKEKFIAGETICQCKDCKEKAVIRGFVNCHGIFYSRDFCQTHEQEYNGHGMDTLP